MVSSEQRASLLEKYRYINVEYDDWWDPVEADFKKDMREVGILLERTYFSGFSSQGDGACFAGGFNSLDVYLDHHHKDQYPMIRKLMKHGGSVWVTCEQSGNYYHERCTSFSTDHDTLYQMVECPTEFHEQIVDTWDGPLEDEVEELESNVIEQWRSYMQDLYRKLAAEHDHLTSDDAVWDTIEANELDEDVEDLYEDT